MVGMPTLRMRRMDHSRIGARCHRPTQLLFRIRKAPPMSDALHHIETALAVLCLEAYRGRDPESMSAADHFTIAEDLKRIDCAIGPKGESIFAVIADKIQETYVELLAARAALKAPPPVQHLVADDATKAAFNHGYVLACCNIANLHDEPSIAFDVLRELGITKAEVKAMELCDYDAKALCKIERSRGNSSLYEKAKSPAPVSREPRR